MDLGGGPLPDRRGSEGISVRLWWTTTVSGVAPFRVRVQMRERGAPKMADASSRSLKTVQRTQERHPEENSQIHWPRPEELLN
jgi:hypothetical protein